MVARISVASLALAQLELELIDLTKDDPKEMSNDPCSKAGNDSEY